MVLRMMTAVQTATKEQPKFQTFVPKDSVSRSAGSAVAAVRQERRGSVVDSTMAAQFATGRAALPDRIALLTGVRSAGYACSDDLALAAWLRDNDYLDVNRLPLSGVFEAAIIRVADRAAITRAMSGVASADTPCKAYQTTRGNRISHECLFVFLKKGKPCAFLTLTTAAESDLPFYPDPTASPLPPPAADSPPAPAMPTTTPVVVTPVTVPTTMPPAMPAFIPKLKPLTPSAPGNAAASRYHQSSFRRTEAEPVGRVHAVVGTALPAAGNVTTPSASPATPSVPAPAPIAPLAEIARQRRIAAALIDDYVIKSALHRQYDLLQEIITP